MGLTGSEDGIDTKLPCLFQGPERITAHIKSAVQGDRHVLCGIHQNAHVFHIQFSVRGQAADHDALGAGLPKAADIACDDGQFFLRIEEISEAGANQDVDPNIGTFSDFFIERKGWRGTSDNQIGTQFQPVGSALLGKKSGLDGIHAAFQKIRGHKKPPFLNSQSL